LDRVGNHSRSEFSPRIANLSIACVFRVIVIYRRRANTSRFIIRSAIKVDLLRFLDNNPSLSSRVSHSASKMINMLFGNKIARVSLYNKALSPTLVHNELARTRPNTDSILRLSLN